MDALPVNAVYRVDCLSLLERMQSGQVALVYVDAPWSTGPAQRWGLPVPTESGNLQEYLSFLSQVLQQIERILAQSGSLYFHSEPRLTGHVRLILDQVFGRENFRMDIIWPSGWAAGARPRNEHDTIFFYSKSDSFTYNREVKQLAEDEMRLRYPSGDEKGPYRLVELTAPGTRPHGQFEWKGSIRPPAFTQPRRGQGLRTSALRRSQKFAKKKVSKDIPSERCACPL
jgi:hypothetical protein